MSYKSLHSSTRRKLRSFISKTSLLLKQKKMALIIILLVGVIFRFPLIGTDYLRTPDALEYVNVARNLNNHLGFVQSIKTHYFDNNQVVTSAFHGRPIGAAIIFAPLLKIGNNNILILQIFSLFVG